MKKLILNARPLLQHNTLQLSIGVGEYSIICQNTFEEVTKALVYDMFPKSIHWKYPEQYLTIKQMALIGEKLNDLDIEIEILSTNPIWATRCKMDNCITIINGKKHSVNPLYGHSQISGDIWDYML